MPPFEAISGGGTEGHSFDHHAEQLRFGQISNIVSEITVLLISVTSAQSSSWSTGYVYFTAKFAGHSYDERKINTN